MPLATEWPNSRNATARWIGNRLLGEVVDGSDFAGPAMAAGGLAEGSDSDACRRQHAQQPPSLLLSFAAHVPSWPQGVAAAACFDRRGFAHQRRRLDASASAQANFSRIVKQQQPCQHWSAFIQPQGRSMQGNGLLRSLTRLPPRGKGRPVTSTS